MARIALYAFAIVVACASQSVSQGTFAVDSIDTPAGDLAITFIGHGTLMFSFAGCVVHVDPWGTLADYTKLPKADIALVTHDHADHFDRVALEEVSDEKTVVVLTASCEKRGGRGIVMRNGDVKTLSGIVVEAVSAYNIVNKRPDGRPFHPKGEGNGYVLTFGGTRVYVAGDTENTPEMKKLSSIDIAFLPMNLPYTMTPEMVTDAASSFKPKILYPYHFGETDASKLVGLLKERPQIEVRVRKMQ